MKIRLFTIPNCVTLCNLLCGALAVITTLTDGNLVLAFWLVIASALFDFLDGMTARLLKQYSEIGVQLDSLADMVSFGLVPSVVIYSMFQRVSTSWDEHWVVLGGLAIFMIVACSALRLAKFNIDDTQHEEFSGLPTPASALFCLSLGWLFDRGILTLSPLALVLLSLCIAALLVSPIRMFSFKFKGLGWHGNELRFIFALGCVALLVWLKIAALPIIIVLYVLISTVRWVLTLNQKEG